MYKLGLLVVLPLVLGGMSPGSKYGASSGSNGPNPGMNIGPNMNMGSSGTNVRMSPNTSNMGPQQPNQANTNAQQNLRIKSHGDIPYQCTMYADRGYFCPYGWSRPSRKFFFNPYSGRCEAFFYLGCGGNLNRHDDKDECVRSCACFANSDFGRYPCSVRSTIRWYFNQYSGSCHRFIYSGCNEGNDNNFRSDLDCQSACGPRPCSGPWCEDGMKPMLVNNGQSNGPAAIGNNGPAAIGNAGSPAPVNAMLAMPNAPQPAIPMQPAIPNAPQPAGMNGMPAAPMISINEPNMQGSSGMNIMTNRVPNSMNSGNKGINMGSIAKIWQMASQSMNQETPSNGMSMTYP